MRSFLLFWVTVMMLVLPATVLAAYRIELHNGGAFVVRNYWQEGNEIRFYRYGGKVGIAKDMVKAVVPVDAELAKELPRAFVGEKIRGAESLTTAESMGTEEFLRLSAAYQSAMQLNYQRSLEQVARLEEARGKEDQEVIDDARLRIRELAREQNELTAKIEQLYGGTLPQWWFDIMERR